MIDTMRMIQGVKPSRLTADERAAQLIRRAWTPAERAVVLTGFFGRCSIAIEPLLCAIVFGAITLGVFLAPHFSPKHVNPDIVVIAPVFGLGLLACVVWLVGVMIDPARALAHTFRPIYVVDGYVRYRGCDGRSDDGTNGYVAVLCDDRRVACEWPTIGDEPLPSHTRPALCEFSEYGGVHTIDGRRTGVIPEKIPLFGVGIHGRKEEIA